MTVPRWPVRWVQGWWTAAVVAAVALGLLVWAQVGPGPGIAVGLLLPGVVACWGFVVQERRTEALRAELALVRRVAAQRADLVAAVGHDVRTPLAMVKVAADLLVQGGPGEINEQQRRFLTTISDQSDQAVAIAEDLLVQARIDAGRFAARFARTDLNRVIADTVRGLRPLAERRDQRIVTDLPRLAPLLSMDERLIRRAVVNLSTNAMRFTRPGGMVVVRVLDNEDWAVVSVTDDGVGMSSAEREKLFRPFVTGSTLADGTGLGLVLTKQIAQLHGGTLLVDTMPQRGTTIMLRLPHRRSS